MLKMGCNHVYEQVCLSLVGVFFSWNLSVSSEMLINFPVSLTLSDQCSSLVL